MKKLFLLMLVGLFLISFTSAWEEDNWVTETGINPNTGYPNIEIKNWFNLGETLAEISLTEHTDTCGINCKSKLEINHAGGVLIDTLEFETLLEDGSWLSQPVRNYRLYYEGEVATYETQCTELEEVCTWSEENQTESCYNPQSCEQIFNVYEPKNITYVVGTEAPEGNYELYLDAKKKPSRTVDWVPTVQGKRLKQLAIWGNISAGDDAEVILNSPADNSTASTNIITFNASANVTNGAFLTNMSLWTNTTGTWALNETTQLVGWGIQKDESWGDTWQTQTSRTGKEGFKIATNETVQVISLTKGSTSTATKGYIQTSHGGGILGTATFTGDVAEFSSPIELNTSISYWILTDKEGSSYTSPYKIGGSGIPKSTGYITWEKAVAGSGTEQDDNAYAIEEIKFNSSLTLNSSTQTWTKTISDTTIWNVQACDTDGDCGFSEANYTVHKPNLIENNQIFNNATVETSTEPFIADVTYADDRFDLITATLYYNGTPYLGTKSGTGERLNFSTLVAVPNVETQTNFTFYWQIGLIDDSGTTYVNLTAYNQTVDIINMSLCGAPHTVPFINFTVKDADTGLAINSNFKSTLTYSTTVSSSTNPFSYSDTTETTNEFDFCMDPSTFDYKLDTNIEVSASGYTTKFFTWQDLLITNATVEKDLYLLNETSSTSFIVQVIDAGNNKKVGVQVEIERFSTGVGAWLLDEVLTTNFEGKTISHLATEDVDYRFKVYETGVSIYNSTSTKIACESLPCTVNLVVPGGIPTGLEQLGHLTTSLTYNEITNIFTFTFEDNSETFSSGEINVYKFNAGNSSDNALVCTSSSSTSSAVVICDISSEVNGTYKAVGTIVRTDTGSSIVETLYGYKGDTIYNQVGEDGVLWAFFLFMGIVMIGVYRPSLAILSAVIGIIMVSALNIINIGITAIVAVIALAIVLLVQVKKE